MKEIIESYLLGFSKSTGWDKYKPELLDNCISYITGEAKKKASHGVAMIEDKEVYGWAVHFYDEDGNVGINKAEPVKVTTPEVEIKHDKVKPNKIAKESKKKEEDYEELTLF